MKKLLFFCLAILCVISASAQYNIIVKIYGFKADSLFLSSFNFEKNKFVVQESRSYADEVVLKGKKSLAPGYYVVSADSMDMAAFFISDEKNQKFQIEVWNDMKQFSGSEENSAFLSMKAREKEFDNRLKVLDNEFAEIQKNSLPQYMKQTMVDSLVARAKRIMGEKENYMHDLIERFQGTLFASYVQSQLQLPEPPQSCYGNRDLYNIFLADTLLANYPWHDERFLATPFAHNILADYMKVIFYMPQNEAVPRLLKNLRAAQVNETQLYAVFDYFEKMFGSLTSPYRDEKLYIPMLKQMLEYKNLESGRKARYEFELSMIDKNNEGDILPDFPMLMSTGETLSLHQVPAEYMLVYFQNPDCPTCSQVREKMKTMTHLKNAIASGRLKVLTVYFESDESLWRRYLKEKASPDYLHAWNYTLSIEADNLYDTRVIPMMMFVDKDKKVIRKDIPYNDLEPLIQKLGLSK